MLPITTSRNAMRLTASAFGAASQDESRENSRRANSPENADNPQHPRCTAEAEKPYSRNARHKIQPAPAQE